MYERLVVVVRCARPFRVGGIGRSQVKPCPQEAAPVPQPLERPVARDDDLDH